MRRLGPILCAFALVLAGCGSGTQTSAQKTRQAFLFAHPKLTDPQLAALCPSSFPADFLSKGGPKKYNYKKDSKPYVVPAALKAQATKAMGCTDVGTKPTGTTTTPTTSTATTPTTSTPASTTTSTATTPGSTSTTRTTPTTTPTTPTTSTSPKK